MGKKSIQYLRRMVMVVVCVLLVSCSGREVQRTDTGAEKFKTLVASKFGESAESFVNSAKTAVLCVKRSKPTTLAPQRRVSFFIYNLVTEKVVFEDEVANGTVAWKDDKFVVVEFLPGMEKSDDTSQTRRLGYIIDVATGRKSDLGNAVVN